MVRDSYIIYEAESEEKKEKLKRLYGEFKEQYSPDITKGRLIVKERSGKDGIKISPEQTTGKIHTIGALKPASELEIKLIRFSWAYKDALFKTKNNEVIEVKLTYQKE
jgi:hypothetical protein